MIGLWFTGIWWENTLQTHQAQGRVTQFLRLRYSDSPIDLASTVMALKKGIHQLQHVIDARLREHDGKSIRDTVK
ncbi:MAG: hypothetical protein Q9N02_11210 [Ghiorsea sp.]|nr:hypothetical protein [Ghiorsea sp.]